MSATIDGTPTGLYVGNWQEVWRIGLDGDAHRIWEKIVPRIDDEILDCAIFLYASESDAAEGTDSGGCGFLVAVPYENGKGRHIYAVTNSHVISGDLSEPKPQRAVSPIVRLNTKDGFSKTYPLKNNAWHHHRDRDDLAVALLHLDSDAYRFEYIFASNALMVDESRLKLSALGAGDETFMVGRFIGRDERQRNMPVVRFGHMASADVEPINQGPERNNHNQDSFIVETHSISGFSGSPVFVWVPYTRIHHRGSIDNQNDLRRLVASEGISPRAWLLGVNWGHLDEKWKGSNDYNVFPGMAGVVPAWKLLELLNDPEVLEMRRQEEKQSKGTHGKLDTRVKGTQISRAGKEIPIPSKAEVMDVFKKATRKRKPS